MVFSFFCLQLEMDEFDFDDLGDSPPPLEWPIPFEAPTRPTTPLPMEDMSSETTSHFSDGFKHVDNSIVRPTPRRARSTERYTSNKELRKRVRASLTPSRSWSRRNSRPEWPKYDTRSSAEAAEFSVPNDNESLNPMDSNKDGVKYDLSGCGSVAHDSMDSSVNYPVGSGHESCTAQNPHLVTSILNTGTPEFSAGGATSDAHDVSAALTDLTKRLLAEWQVPPPNHNLFVPYVNQVGSQCESTQTTPTEMFDKAVQATLDCDCGPDYRKTAPLICSTCDGRVVSSVPPARAAMHRALSVNVVETGEHSDSSARARGFIVVPAPVIGSTEWRRMTREPPTPPPAHQTRRASLSDIAQCVARERTIRRFEDAMNTGEGDMNRPEEMALDLSRPTQ